MINTMGSLAPQQYNGNGTHTDGVHDMPRHLSHMTQGVAAPPILIFGIARRSGTNFLFQLLLLHKACRAGNVVLEDFFLSHVDLLETYTNAVYREWDHSWREALADPHLLLTHLGQGLIAFLNAESLKDADARAADEALTRAGIVTRVVTKTPSVSHLSRCFQLFPTAKPIILVRDGRAVVESSVRSFRRNYEQVAHEWAAAAAEIQALIATQPADRYLLIRYEDLQQNTEVEVRKILAFLDLDPALYDFDAMRALPIFGSSQIVSEGARNVHWEGNQFADFDPNQRWANWEQGLHERFNRIAGAAMVQFGYTLRPNQTPLPIRLAQTTGYELRWQLWKRIRPLRQWMWRQWAKAKHSST